MTRRAVRVLVVDDSATARRALARAFEGHGDIVVVGEAASGSAALAAIAELAPDLVTLDVHLGAEDGVTLAGQIMATRAVPILVVTGVDPGDPGLAFRAIQAGALDVIGKPPGPNDPRYPAERTRLVRLVRALAAVPVVTRAVRREIQKSKAPTTIDVRPGTLELVAIGASTGGPPALEALLNALPRPFPVPLAIVQHITEGFGGTFATWLGAVTGRRVLVCPARHEPKPGDVILAPDDAHLAVHHRGLLVAQPGPPRAYQRPSVDTLFESVAATYGPRAVGVLLTGMGRDGADGLFAMRNAGAATVVQDPATCAVGSMPSAALECGGASLALTIPRIASLLQEHTGPAR